MDESSRRSGLAPEIGVLALVGASTLPLGRLFREAAPDQLGIGTVQLLTVLVAGGVAWGLRRLRLPVLVSAVAAAAAFFWFGAALFHPRELAGPFPTPHAVSLLMDSIRAGMRGVSVEAAPVPPAAAFLSLTALGIWATTWLADDAAVRLRHPLLAVGLTLPLFAMPGTLIRGDRAWVDVALFCSATLLVLFLDERARLARWAGGPARSWQPGLAGRLAAVAVAAGILVAPMLPGYSQPPGGALRAGTGTRVTVNPLVAVRPSLNEAPIATLFTVRSRTPLYWRLTSLDRFNGEVWTAASETARLSPGRGGVARSNPSSKIVEVEQDFEIDDLAGPWVPAAFEPVRVDRIRGVSMQPTSRTMLVSGGFRTGQTFRVISEIPAPTAQDLIADDGPDPEGDRYLQLPSRLPSQIPLLALGYAGGARTRLEKAVAIQNHLRTFEYDENVALRHGSGDLVAFLTNVKAGYCEQFAAAMAVLARSIGIPARVAVGFGTGDPGATPDQYQVTSRHAHAWVEVHFPSYGWVQFEPTPRSGGFSPPSYAQPAAVPQVPDPAPSATASPSSASPTAVPSERDRGEDLPAGSADAANQGLPVLPLGAGVLVLVAAAAIPGAALVRARMRRSRSAPGAQMVGVRYVEFLEWCNRVALARSPGETPVEHARRLSSVEGVADAEPVRTLARVATEAVYAAEPGEDGASARDVAVRARAALRPAVPRWRRAVAHTGWGWWRRA